MDRNVIEITISYLEKNEIAIVWNTFLETSLNLNKIIEKQLIRIQNQLIKISINYWN